MTCTASVMAYKFLIKNLCNNFSYTNFVILFPCLSALSFSAKIFCEFVRTQSQPKKFREKLQHSKQLRVMLQPFDFIILLQRSSHHSFSLLTCSSSSSVKSFLMLNVRRISSGVFPLIIFATILAPISWPTTKPHRLHT